MPRVRSTSIVDMFGEVTRIKEVNLSVFLDLILQIWWKFRLRFSSSSRMSFSEMSESTDLMTTENRVGFLVGFMWGILGGFMGPISMSEELVTVFNFLEKSSGRGSETMRRAVRLKLTFRTSIFFT